MYEINAYQIDQHFAADLKPLTIKRDWMDKTFDQHAYRCFPLSLANQIGWGFSFPEDITIVWDGNDSEQGRHIKVLKGNQYVNTDRGTATLIFNIGWFFKTKQDVSMLFYGPPNLIIDGATPLTNIISTSFWNSPIPVSWKITRPNVEITFKANEPVIAMMPVSLSNLNDSIVNLYSNPYNAHEYHKKLTDYGNVILENNKIPKWSDFYRNATDERGNKIGEHEVKKIKLFVEDNRNKT